MSLGRLLLMSPQPGLGHVFIPEPITSKGKGKAVIGLAYLFEVEGRALKYYHISIIRKRRLRLTEMK